MGDPLDYVDQVNLNTKNYPPVTHLIEIAPEKGERIVRICRCWQSKKFPYCDDTHKVLVEAGDNVGPFIAKLKGANQPRQVNPVKNVSAVKSLGNPRGVRAAIFLLSALSGYQAASILKGLRKRELHVSTRRLLPSWRGLLSSQ